MGGDLGLDAHFGLFQFQNVCFVWLLIGFEKRFRDWMSCMCVALSELVVAVVCMSYFVDGLAVG